MEDGEMDRFVPLVSRSPGLPTLPIIEVLKEPICLHQFSLLDQTSEGFRFSFEISRFQMQVSLQCLLLESLGHPRDFSFLSHGNY
jgi:hypothetical protein